MRCHACDGIGCIREPGGYGTCDTCNGDGDAANCPLCHGTGIERHHFHGVWPNGEECVEPIKCAACDGLGGSLLANDAEMKEKRR